MEKKKNLLLSIGFAVLVLFTILHTSFHFTVSGTGIKGFGEAGISGHAITDNKFLNDVVARYSKINLASKLLIAAEWLAIILIIITMLVKGEREKLEEEAKLKIVKADYTKPKLGDTDLDVFYKTLKNKKSLRVSTVSKLFGINSKTAMHWCEILESGNLAEINYPLIGGPLVSIPGKDKKSKDEKAKK